MEAQIGIDKDKILSLSKKLRDGWNRFFWEYRVCQYHIRFTKEERSNYIGDLFNYFDDIIHHLEKFNVKPDYLSSLYETVAVLQFMYVQQDLVDELLRLFKLHSSSSDDKTFIRQLRNELIGHPVSRDYNGNLISSVFITGSTKNSTLSYIRYHKDNDYKHDLIMLKWEKIFERHEKYLEFYLTTILHKMQGILLHFVTVLSNLQGNFSKTPFERLVPWVNKVFETYSNNFILFSPENILHCYQHQYVHNRYKYAVESFQEGLAKSIGEVIQEINEFCMPSEEINYKEPLENIVEFVSYSESSENDIKPRNGEKINYEFSKLYEKDYLFELNYFKNEFRDDIEIVQELDNIALSNGKRNVEFYCSYEYLRFLFEQKNML